MKEKAREWVCGCNYKKKSYSFSANMFTLNIHFIKMRLKQNKIQTKKSWQSTWECLQACTVLLSDRVPHLKSTFSYVEWPIQTKLEYLTFSNTQPPSPSLSTAVQLHSLHPPHLSQHQRLSCSLWSFWPHHMHIASPHTLLNKTSRKAESAFLLTNTHRTMPSLFKSVKTFLWLWRLVPVPGPFCRDGWDTLCWLLKPLRFLPQQICSTSKC